MKLKNRIAIITGGGKGIGAELSLKLASEGGKLLLLRWMFQMQS